MVYAGGHSEMAAKGASRDQRMDVSGHSRESGGGGGTAFDRAYDKVTLDRVVYGKSAVRCPVCLLAPLLCVHDKF